MMTKKFRNKNKIVSKKYETWSTDQPQAAHRHPNLPKLDFGEFLLWGGLFLGALLILCDGSAGPAACRPAELKVIYLRARHDLSELSMPLTCSESSYIITGSPPYDLVAIRGRQRHLLCFLRICCVFFAILSQGRKSIRGCAERSHGKARQDKLPHRPPRCSFLARGFKF